MSKIRLGEPVFRSVQGEGDMTGRLSIWVRFFGCNLNCNGFMQKDPTDESMYILPYLGVDVSKITRVEDLPVFAQGCDSGYSWAPKFKKFTTDYASAKDLVEQAINPLLYDGAHGKTWYHPLTDNSIDLCFTGGEPMMQQKAMVEIMREVDVNSKAICVQVETNGTKPVDSVLKQFYYEANGGDGFYIHFNISPKLYHVSGEKNAVKYDIIRQYQELTQSGMLKFVMNNDPRAWAELNEHVKNLQSEGIYLQPYIMPVGATAEQQKDSDVLKEIANRAIDNGYHVSGRLHAILFGNTVGV